METKTAGAGRFTDFDLNAVPSPCFVIDTQKIAENLATLATIQNKADVRILLALKAFSLWSVADMISGSLSGCCASGLWEARLARQYYGGILSTFSPAYKQSELDTLCSLSDHLIANSPAQLQNMIQIALAHQTQTGLRLNPGLVLGEVDMYDPSAPGSRLGMPLDQFERFVAKGGMADIDGLHMHSLCEQGYQPLATLVEQIRPALDMASGAFSWLNLGGGHMLTHPDYDTASLIALLTELAETYQAQIYLEPGTAIAFDAGILVGEILDVIDNDGAVAITDISATCHMPDVLEAPYRPALLGEAEAGVEVALGGPSCLAGDRIGSYQFADRPQAGQRIAFLDQAHYSMVKTTSFNGVMLPSIALWDSQADSLNIIRQFDYEDFRGRLS